MAVVPFSVPVNVSEKSDQQPGLGNRIAWRTQAELVRWGVIPIVEVLPREDWPGKQEEILTGNFGALERAHAARYDLLLVGRLLPSQSLSEMTAIGKVISVEDGITLWYGEVGAYTYQGEADRWKAAVGLEKYNPSKIYSNPISEKLAYCIAKQVMSEEVTPS